MDPRQSTPEAGKSGRMPDPSAMLRLGIAFLFGFAGVILASTLAGAQAANRAGLVVQFSDGHTESKCVSFSESQVTGLDLLTRAGYSTNAEINALGAAVCSISNDGCAFPGENCFCKCQDPGGANCAYWRYFHLSNNAWQFASSGAGTYKVGNGMVDGWRFSPGTQNSAAGPPLTTFEQVCPAATATPVPATSTATRTATPVPSSPTPSVTPVPPSTTPAPLPTTPLAATAQSFSPIASATRAAIVTIPARTSTARPASSTPAPVAAAPALPTDPPTAIPTDLPPTPIHIVISVPSSAPTQGAGPADAVGYIFAGVAVLGLGGLMLFRLIKPR